MVAQRNKILGKESTALLLSIMGFLIYTLTLCAVYFQEKPINLGNFRSIFIDYLAFFYYSVYLIMMALIFKEKYDIMSGTFSLIVSLLAFFGLEILGFNSVNYLLQHLVHMAVASLVLGNVLAFWCYIRGLSLPPNEINPKTIGKDTLYCYIIGREVRPRLFGYLDLKMYVNRICVVSAVLLDCAFLYQELIRSLTLQSYDLNKSFIVMEVIHLIYCFDGVVAEYTYEYSLEIQKDGFGYVSAVGYFIYPFIISTVPYHFLQAKTELAAWKLVTIICLFTVGFLLFRIANNQKYNFKVNAQKQGAKFPTNSKNKKLLCSGLWGFVRHPNYLGDILMNISYTGLTISTTVILPLLEVPFLIHRSIRDNKLCREKYGDLWHEYCEKVKYVLIPRIY
ncbi:Lamin-B receptor-like Protein [Tribolium castaneum]|uniref:Lamin-B receptor-like Protein n=1 Tax=Tribolium castaneum TaxID=7070 RepID=A0A139WJA9_TRICA|nr:PREDICTED: lamin-B receptor-like [Tribolium castaneum]XP_015835090.1 PREDICTED: lamin-B receptor-like [Tribolium castaneum]KYB27897.1 Lamin-B receptor-like Protein [Tribolium castaneum]|eukprot:XP_015835089.1 PREDICTED: lamin-B receptor-like [Tribolium castaneum]